MDKDTQEQEGTTDTEITGSEVVSTDTTETTEKKEAAPDTEDGKAEEGETKPDTDKDREGKPPKGDKDARKEFFKKQERERRERERQRDIELAELRAENRVLKEYGLKKPEAPKPEDAVKHYSEQFAQHVPKPKADDYETVAEHAEAIADWKWQQNEFVKSETAKAKDVEKRNSQTKEETEKQVKAVRDRLEALNVKGEEKYEDYEEIVGAATYPVEVLAEIADAENGDEIAYYLAHNPEEVDKLEKLQGRSLTKAVDRIALGLETGKLVVKKTTTAPPPPKTVNGNANPRTPDDKMSDEDWGKRKRKEKLSSA